MCNLIATSDWTGATPIQETDIASGTAIESDLRSFHSEFTIFDSEAPRYPLEYAAEFAVEQEIWRNLGLILLNRHVFRKSVFERDMRRLISLVLSLLRSLPQVSLSRVVREGVVNDWWSLYYTTPAFLVGSMLIDVSDRQFVRRLLQELGNEKALEDMLLMLEVTWMATDMNGQVADWFEESQKLGLGGVVFF